MAWDRSAMRKTTADIVPMVHTKTRGPILTTGTTAKEEGFARAVALEGMNLSDAYRASHCTADMSPNTVWNKASLVARKSRVRVRVIALRSEMERKTYDSAVEIRRLVVERLYCEALSAPQANARIRALELLGKLDTVGLFRERREVEVVDERSAADITAELTAKLRAWLPQHEEGGA